jgi:hypothetical protein
MTVDDLRFASSGEDISGSETYGVENRESACGNPFERAARIVGGR